MKNLDKKLESFLNQFSNNAKSWSEATDEIRDLAHTVRTNYNELILDVLEGEAGYVEALDFRSFKTPAQRNTEAKKQITELWAKMTDWAKECVFDTVGFNI